MNVKEEHIHIILSIPHDAKDIANKILHILDNPDIANRLGKKEREWLKNNIIGDQKVKNI